MTMTSICLYSLMTMGASAHRTVYQLLLLHRSGLDVLFLLLGEVLFFLTLPDILFCHLLPLPYLSSPTSTPTRWTGPRRSWGLSRPRLTLFWRRLLTP